MIGTMEISQTREITTRLATTFKSLTVPQAIVISALVTGIAYALHESFKYGNLPYYDFENDRLGFMPREASIAASN